MITITNDHGEPLGVEHTYWDDDDTCDTADHQTRDDARTYAHVADCVADHRHALDGTGVDGGGAYRCYWCDSLWLDLTD